MQALEHEWELRLPLLSNVEIVSIYFGGGTPALLGPSALHKIIEWIFQSPAAISSDVEITLEANPENITEALMREFSHAGVNRISIGIQSLDDALLHTLGRTHGAKQAINAVEATYHAGLTNISVDLMYDLPGQTLAEWERTLHQVVLLPISHLSLYNLTIEPHTVFFKHQAKIQPLLPDAEASLLMYQTAINVLENAALKQYEISAFSRDGRYSKHNVGYWTAREFLGFGPSAFSYWKGSRFRNVCNLSKYSKLLLDQRLPVDFEETLSKEAKLKELLTIQLRLREGVDLNLFQQQHGFLDEETGKSLVKLQEMKLIRITNQQAILTDRGVLFYDSVAEELI